MHRVFIRTSQGNDELCNPSGVLSGDEKRLMELIDDSLSLSEIKSRVPLSVQRQLDAILARLLSMTYIAQTDSGMPDEKPEKTSDDIQPLTVQDDPTVKERTQRVELEREVAALRAELTAMMAHMSKLDAGCNEVRERIAEQTRSMRAKLTEKVDAGRNDTKKDNELSLDLKFLEGLDKLNQSLLEQQQHLEKTLKLNALQADTAPRRSEPDAVEKVRSHPHYGKMRGLDFFKSFGNAELLQFLELAKWQDVKEGETVLHAGEAGLPFYIVVSGSVSVFYERNQLASLKQGDAFGEFSHLSGEFPLRSAQVKATTACELLVVDPLDIEFSTLQIRLHVAEALLRGQVRKVLRANQLLSSLSAPSEF